MHTLGGGVVPTATIPQQPPRQRGPFFFFCRFSIKNRPFFAEKAVFFYFFFFFFRCWASIRVLARLAILWVYSS